MRSFFPDAHELVDPGYDFARRHDPPHGVGQQGGRYAHELFDPAPYDGLLLSRAVVQGKGSDADGRFRDARYKPSEQQRLFRVGAREFFRAGNRPLLFLATAGRSPTAPSPNRRTRWTASSGITTPAGWTGACPSTT